MPRDGGPVDFGVERPARQQHLLLDPEVMAAVLVPELEEGQPRRLGLGGVAQGLCRHQSRVVIARERTQCLGSLHGAEATKRPTAPASAQRTAWVTNG